MNEENPLVDLPTITDLPYYASGDAELQAQGYGNTPANNPNIALYQPSYKNNTRDLVEGMRADMMSDLSFGGGKQDTLSSIINSSNKKIDISGGYVKANDAYDTLSDGTLLPKYKMYKPGVNNEDYNASMQSSTEKFINPIIRGNIKVGRGILADIGSFVYGVGEAAITGRAESLFDNGMSNWVDDMDKRTDFNYKNYYTEAQNGLGFNVYTLDKVLGGAEFTARMLGAEAVIALATGGTSLPASLARTGARIGLGVAKNTTRLSRTLRGLRTAEALEDVMEVGARAGRATRIMNEPIANVARQGGGMFSAERYQRGIESAINGGKMADYLKQGRFAVTGSMYEAGFEARHYQKEAEDAFWEYHRAQGVEPTQEQVGDFYNKVDDTTWGVFGANMGILSVSNLALFGNMLNIKPMFPKSSIGSFLDRSVFKIGTQRGADGVWAPLKSNFFNKALAYSAPVAKGAFTEGVFEEGGQGIASGMMKNYMAATYDPKAMKETADYSSAFTKAFKDQYSTKEGIEEVVIGGIIGGLFGGGMGMMNTASKYKNQAFTAQVQNTMPQVADSIVSNLYTNENLSNIFGHSNRLQGINDRIENAKAKGDITGSALHSAESFISMLQASTSVGKSDEFMDVLKDSFRGMDSGKLAEGQNIKPEDVEAFKAEKIKGVERIAEDYSKAREAAGYIFGRGKIGGFYEVEGKKVNRQNLIDAFAYTSAMGGVSQQIASDSFNAFQQKLAQVGTDPSVVEEFGTMAALQTAGEMERLRYVSATTEETRLIKQRKKLEDQILRLQKSEMTPEITQKLENLAEELQNLGAEITSASQNKDLYWRSIADNFYDKLGTQGYLPQIEFESFNKKTGVLQDFLNRSSLAEYDKLELNKLLEEFGKANDLSKSFGKLASNLSDPNFTFKTYNNIFSGLRAKSDSSLNDATKEALLDLYNTDTKVQSTLTEFQLRPSLSTDDVVKSISEDDAYQVQPDVIAEVTNKVKNNNALSENEKVVYEKYKQAIDDSLSQVIVDPINVESEDTEISNRTVQINANKAEIKELKKGNLTPEIQAEIDRINSEIETLKQERDSIIPEIANNQPQIDEINQRREEELAKKVTTDADATSKNKGKTDTTNDIINRNSERIKSLRNEDGSISKENLEEFNRLKKQNQKLAVSVETTQDTLDRLKGRTIKDIIHSSFKGIVRLNNPHAYNILSQKLKEEGFTEDEINQILDLSENSAFEATKLFDKIYNDKINAKYDAEIEALNTNQSQNNTSQIEAQRQAELDRIDSVNEEISTLENSKDFIVSDRITDLETENEELKSKESADKKLQKKKDSLANRISTLRAEILNDIARNSWNIDIDVENISMDRSSSAYPKIKKLRKLESDLKNLNKIKEEFNPNASYSEQLDWVVKNSNVLEYETVDEIITASPPSQEEIDRYSELDSKKRKTKKDKEEIAELREKILPHKLVEGSFFGGIPLIDIIQVNNQSKEVKDVENTQIERLLQEDVQAAIAMVQNQDQTPEFRASNVALVYDGVFMKGGSAVQGIFHVKLGTMLNAGLANNLDMTVSEFTTDKDGKVEYSEPSTVDGLNIDEISSKYDNFNGVRFTIGDEIVMEKSETGTNFNVTGDLAGLMGLTPYAITGQPTSYVLLYEQKSDGTLAPKESEYEVTRDGNVIPFDKETLNKIKPGDEVTLFYDETDDYNKKLKKSDRAKKGNIYVMKNGNLVNILKADTEYRTNTEGWAELSDLRKKVFENKTVKVKVKNSYLGLPIIHIGSDGRAIEQEIKEDIVQSYGYLDSTGEYHFFDNTTVDNSQYTDPYKQMGKNIPVVAFKYNDRVYTFPVQVYAEGIDAQSELDDILNDQTSNEYQKMFKTNMLLDKYNLKTDEMQWTNQNDSLEAIRTALSSIQGKIDITSKDSVEKARKTILLNMNDPFMSSKLVLDIKESTETLNESNTKTKGDVTIEPSTSIGEDLSNENKC